MNKKNSHADGAIFYTPVSVCALPSLLKPDLQWIEVCHKCMWNLSTQTQVLGHFAVGFGLAVDMDSVDFLEALRSLGHTTSNTTKMRIR